MILSTARLLKLMRANFRKLSKLMRGGLVLSLVLLAICGVLYWSQVAERRNDALSNLLIVAISSGDPRKVSLALDQGANPNMKALFTGLYVHEARSPWQILLDLTNRMLGNKPTTSADSKSIWPILLVALERSAPPPVIKVLLDRGASIHARTGDGDTALVWPALTGDAEMARLLIKYGADVNAKTDAGKSILTLAKNQVGGTEVINVLKQAGARD